MRTACSICLGSILTSGGDDSDPSIGHSVGAISATECGHVFHETCLLRWLQKSRSCPTCRKQLRPDRVIRLFLDTGDYVLPGGGDELQALRLQLVDARLRLAEAAIAERRQEAVADELRSDLHRAQSIARTYNAKYASSLRENCHLRADLRAMREEVRDKRQLRRENTVLQTALNAKEREIRNCVAREVAVLKGELRRSEYQIRAQALRIRKLEEELQRHQIMLRCSDVRLNTLRQRSQKRAPDVGNTSCSPAEQAR
ncbi:hypothetical protein V5799_000820 [Amblyomma americanum]|uniref:RING-type domain-containing protein n=1 Tax=Amblyomma americanum TaxID=6943 RepID=A0AAQ4D1Y9_AMBAM